MIMLSLLCAVAQSTPEHVQQLMQWGMTNLVGPLISQRVGVNFKQYSIKALEKEHPLTQEVRLKLNDPSYRALNPDFWGITSEAAPAQPIWDAINQAAMSFYVKIQTGLGWPNNPITYGLEFQVHGILNGMNWAYGQAPNDLIQALDIYLTAEKKGTENVDGVLNLTNFSNIIKILFADYAKILLVKNPNKTASEIVEMSAPFVDQIIAIYTRHFDAVLQRIQQQGF